MITPTGMRPLDVWTAVLTVVCLVLLGIVVYLVLRPAPLPRIVDEHGTNLVYRCPGDPRCTPVVR